MAVLETPVKRVAHSPSHVPAIARVDKIDSCTGIGHHMDLRHRFNLLWEVV